MDFERIREIYHYVKKNIAERGGDPSEEVEAALDTAEILGEMNSDEETIAAALLYPLMAADPLNENEIRERFGNAVLSLAKGISRTDQLKFKSRLEEQAENFRMMILAMSRDIRVVLLKLAIRLQLMRSIEKFDETEQQEIAEESLEIYAPLANRLGIARVKWEMEDLCLKVLHPSIYQELEEKVPQTRKQSSSYIKELIRLVEEELKQNGFPGKVMGRTKHYYSIYQKIVKRGVSFDEIFDLIAIRVITDTKNRCYAILGMIHSLWKPVPGRFKDYIGVPKSNMYQSLHTTVIGPGGHKVEFQIRTEEMHRIAEHGIAAHWKYKEGNKTPPSLEQRFAWLRQLLEWQKELKSPREFLESVKTDFFEESLFIFTPRGEVKELPSGSTPLDFAYSIHSDVGNHCSGARVNNRMVPLKYELKTGDTVEILTSRNQVPSKDWLKLVKSTKARNRIRHFLKQEEQKQGLSLGQEILEKEARKHGLTFSKLLKTDPMQIRVGELGFSSIEKLIAAVGFGRISARQVLGRFLPQEEPAGPPAVVPHPGPAHRKKTRDGIRIRGLEGILVHFAGCCNPVPGDDVIGFVTRGKGVSIHRMDCVNVRQGAHDPQRFVEVDWDLHQESLRPARISVTTNNRPGILANISAQISKESINISRADIRTSKAGQAILQFELEIRNKKDLDRIIRSISRLKEVIEVRRVMGSY